MTTEQSTPDSVHTSLSHVQNGEPHPTAFPKDNAHCKPVSPLGKNGLTKTDFPSLASQNKIVDPTEGNLIVLLGDFYYGKADTKNVGGKARGEMILGLPEDEAVKLAFIDYFKEQGLAVSEVTEDV